MAYDEKKAFGSAPILPFKPIKAGSEEERFEKHRARFHGVPFDLEEINHQRAYNAFKAWHQKELDKRDGIVRSPSPLPQVEPVCEQSTAARSPPIDISDEQANGEAPRDLIYGISPLGNLVFIERHKALENLAFREAETWGDLRENAPLLYERAVLSYESEGDEDEPPDDLEFDHEIAADGDFLHWAEQLMLDFVPESIQKFFGRVEESVFNGPMLELDGNREHDIVLAMKSRGFLVCNDQELIDAMYL
jgi:hypothetical protein